MIAGMMNYRGKIIHDKERTSDVRRHLADITMAKNIIDYKPQTSLEDGLRKTINWYLSRFDGRI